MGRKNKAAAAVGCSSGMMHKNRFLHFELHALNSCQEKILLLRDVNYSIQTFGGEELEKSQ